MDVFCSQSFTPSETIIFEDSQMSCHNPQTILTINYLTKTIPIEPHCNGTDPNKAPALLKQFPTQPLVHSSQINNQSCNMMLCPFTFTHPDFSPQPSCCDSTMQLDFDNTGADYNYHQLILTAIPKTLPC
jgi:hypothetical protein